MPQPANVRAIVALDQTEPVAGSSSDLMPGNRILAFCWFASHLRSAVLSGTRVGPDPEARLKSDRSLDDDDRMVPQTPTNISPEIRMSYAMQCTATAPKISALMLPNAKVSHLSGHSFKFLMPSLTCIISFPSVVRCWI